MLNLSEALHTAVTVQGIPHDAAYLELSLVNRRFRYKLIIRNTYTLTLNSETAEKLIGKPELTKKEIDLFFKAEQALQAAWKAEETETEEKGVE